MSLTYYRFRNKRSTVEYTREGEEHSYFPEGVVVTVNYDMPIKDRLDVLVLYASPRGVFYREFKGFSEVDMEEIPKVEWDLSKKKIENAKLDANNSALMDC